MPSSKVEERRPKTLRTADVAIIGGSGLEISLNDMEQIPPSEYPASNIGGRG